MNLSINECNMKYIDEFRDMRLVRELSTFIAKSVVPGRNYTFMEVCGGHTRAIRRFGIPSVLPESIRLISGPGCPVCVTATEFIDMAVAYSEKENIIITTFGDLIRVPGSFSTLEKMKTSGADIRIVISGLEALDIARNNPGKITIFLGIGFETTAPGTAVTIKQAELEGIRNFFLLSAHKIMPPAMEVLIRDGIKIDGFICPGHVAAITGSEVFKFIPEKYRLGCVVTGFEPVDLLQSILLLTGQVNTNSPQLEIQYGRAVSEKGNPIAQRYLSEVFRYCDTEWRGLGIVPESGLKLRNELEWFDAEKQMPLNIKHHKNNDICICGEILRGLSQPPECPLFGTSCTPGNPVGACMVSDEGACNTFYKYRTYA
jgi:hydrogenase expression/formation protein HypD